MKDDALRGHLRALLLATLARGPAHGYAVAQTLRELTDSQLDVPEGSLYPALRRLEEDALVESRWDTSNKRRRRIYEVTAAGKEALTSERENWRRTKKNIDRVLETPT